MSNRLIVTFTLLILVFGLFDENGNQHECFKKIQSRL